MSKTPHLVAILLAGLAVLPLATAAQEPTATVAQVRLGTFDSRVVAIAFYRSEMFQESLAEVRAAHEKASAAGDSETTAALEQDMRAKQEHIHRQGFSTAPVDEIIARIEAQLPRIAQEAGVDVIVSKWKLAYRSSSAQVTDVSMRLAAEFKPDEATRKILLQIPSTQPVSLAELKQHED